jgi:hypothetical protein
MFNFWVIFPSKLTKKTTKNKTLLLFLIYFQSGSRFAIQLCQNLYILNNQLMFIYTHFLQRPSILLSPLFTFFFLIFCFNLSFPLFNYYYKLYNSTVLCSNTASFAWGWERWPHLCLTRFLCLLEFSWEDLSNIPQPPSSTDLESSRLFYTKWSWGGEETNVKSAEN